ncbi:putative nucleotidyltransferase [Microbacter margulisiae]|uniref:Putative nucleotidyltransferase n=2 Tax=Microbacter margulisiae TaxID=1350067 RepID=A0A7W5DQI5_9PORP|nr:putative nucleotidyltransferase [Microbacter margulisiae]
MRLTQFEINTIVTLAQRHFSESVRVYLFGSRVDDQLKGGDIDLMIQHPDESQLTIRKKILYLVDLKRILGDRKIDVVFDNGLTRSKQSFYKSIQQHSLLLSES